MFVRFAQGVLHLFYFGQLDICQVVILVLIKRFSQIYCNEAIIQAVDKAKIFKDSKTFVDMPLKYSAGTRSTYHLHF